jgi:AAA domain
VTHDRLDANGFGHYRRKGDNRHKHNGHAPRVKMSSTPTNWKARAEEYARNLTAELKQQVARDLGLPADGLDVIHLLGFNPADMHGPCLTFPETDAAGTVIGINRRYSKGKGPDGKDKMAMPGSRRGLTMPCGWRERPGAVYVVEGPTDTAAMTAVGLSCVGKPSDLGGVELLAELLRDLPPDRDIIVVGENDRKPDGKHPGKDGAVATATRLAGSLGRAVWWSMPPQDCKDAREWLTEFVAGAAESVDYAAFGREMVAYLANDATAAVPAAKTPARFTFIDSKELATGDYRANWLVTRVLVERQPAVIAGPSKALKTNISIDMAVSIAAGVPFLGRFDVPARRRVAVVSGESGAATLKETASRICAAKGLELGDLGCWLTWCFDLPTFSEPEVMADFAKELARLEAEVSVLDPTYLMMGDVDMKNLFEAGRSLRGVAEVLLKADCTPVLLHHANRQLPIGEPMELQHLAYSGIEQFARQFVLLNRRERYRGDGAHDLWVTCSGSAGHGGMWSLHVEEGTLDDQFQGRKWDVRLLTLEDAKVEREQHRERQKDQKVADDRQAILDAIDAEVRAGHEGATKTRLKLRTGFNTTKAKEVTIALIEDGIIEEFDFKKTVGKGAKQKLKGFRWVKTEHPDDLLSGCSESSASESSATLGRTTAPRGG